MASDWPGHFVEMIVISIAITKHPYARLHREQGPGW
jgi:hypothetical protein